MGNQWHRGRDEGGSGGRANIYHPDPLQQYHPVDTNYHQHQDAYVKEEYGGPQEVVYRGDLGNGRLPRIHEQRE